jgi:UDP-N-acetylglucosamine pyrophosphorylase
MTSPATHAKLASLLRQHAYYGLQPSQVHLFECDTAPPAFAGEPLKALTLGPARLTRGSAGSGEVFAALKTRCVWLLDGGCLGLGFSDACL